MDDELEKNELRCDACDYSTTFRGDLRKHFLTTKHLRNVAGTTPKESVHAPPPLVCGCGRTFKYAKNLARHKKGCTSAASTDMETLTDAVKTLVAENRKLSEQLRDLVPNASNQIAKRSRKKGGDGPVTNNISGDYKPQYITAIKDSQINMQVFLDNHCSQAINLTTFIETLRLNNSDLDDTRERGLAYSLGKVLIRGLKELEMEKRPIHCSNVRKSVMYVKDNDAWGLDKQETQLRSAINILSSKQVTQIKEWEQAHPDWDKTDAGKQLYAETVHKLLQVARDADKEKIENQVIKTIAKETLVDESI